MATTKVAKARIAHKCTVRPLFANAAPWARQVDVANLLEHLVLGVGHFERKDKPSIRRSKHRCHACRCSGDRHDTPVERFKAERR